MAQLKHAVYLVFDFACEGASLDKVGHTMMVGQMGGGNRASRTKEWCLNLLEGIKTWSTQCLLMFGKSIKLYCCGVDAMERIQVYHPMEEMTFNSVSSFVQLFKSVSPPFISGATSTPGLGERNNLEKGLGLISGILTNGMNEEVLSTQIVYFSFDEQLQGSVTTNRLLAVGL